MGGWEKENFVRTPGGNCWETDPETAQYTARMPTPFPERFSVLIAQGRGGLKQPPCWRQSLSTPKFGPLSRFHASTTRRRRPLWIWAPARVGDFVSSSLNRKWSLVCRCPACAFPHPVSLAHAPLSRPSLLRAPLLYIDWYPLSFRTNRYFAQSPLGLAQGEMEGGEGQKTHT